MSSIEQETVKAIISGKYRFIAQVSTKWHETGAEAYFIKVGKPGGRGLVLIGKHPSAGYLLGADDVNRDLFDAIVITPNKDYRFLNYLFKSLWALRGSIYSPPYPVFIASSTKPGAFFGILSMLTPSSAYRYVQLDEGIGTYLWSDQDWDRITFHETGTRRNSFVGLIKSTLAHRLDARTEPFLLFDNSGNPICEVSNAYTKALTLHSQPDPQISFNSNSIIFCTGPYREEHFIGDQEYRRIIETIKHVVSSCGFELIVKPHPREIGINLYVELGLSVLDEYQESIENLFAGSASLPYAIVGFSSTALVSSSVLFRLKSICIDLLLDNESSNERFREVTNRYLNYFSKVVLFPSSSIELSRLITRSNYRVT